MGFPEADCLDVISLGEHIKRLHILQPIATCRQALAVAGERSRVAGDVDDTCRPQRDQRLQGRARTSGPRWIEDRGVKAPGQVRQNVLGRRFV